VRVGGWSLGTSLNLLAGLPTTSKPRQFVEVWTQHTAKADGTKHDREAHLCVHALCRAGLCWGAAGGWHNLPVVVLACQVGGRPFFQLRNSVHQMVPLIHQAANPLQVSVHLKKYNCCSGCSVSCDVTGSTVVETSIAVQVCKPDSSDAANKLQIRSVSNLANDITKTL